MHQKFYGPRQGEQLHCPWPWARKNLARRQGERVEWTCLETNPLWDLLRGSVDPVDMNFIRVAAYPGEGEDMEP